MSDHNTRYRNDGQQQPSKRSKFVEPVVSFSPAPYPLNKLNRYLDNPPDFNQLLKNYTPPPLPPSNSPSFTIPILHETMKADFQISHLGTVFTAHPDHLVPVVPGRLDYLCVIKQFLLDPFPSTSSSSSSSSSTPTPASTSTKPKGIDLGCGPCAIYALLGSREFSWSFDCLEIDPSSVESATKLLQSNSIPPSSIRVIPGHDYFASISTSTTTTTTTTTTTKSLRLLLPLAQELSSGVCYSFLMCNPPFYDSSQTKQKQKVSERSERVL